MDVKRLESFCRVFELKSFSKAAAELFLSQPTVSSHIASLEEELSCQLFDRIGRYIHPTQAGTILYGYASHIIEHIERAVSEIHVLHNRVVGRLGLGASTIPSHYLLPQVLKRFSDRYREVTIVLHTGDSESIEERILNGELDIGVIGGSQAFAELAYTPVLKDELRVLARQDLCPNGGTMDRDRLCRLPWIVREKGSGTRKAMEAGLAHLGLSFDDLHTVITVHTTEAVMQSIKAGLGISITSMLVASESLTRGEVCEIQVPDLHLDRRFYAVTHRHRQQYPAASRFMDTLAGMTAEYSKNTALSAAQMSTEGATGERK